MIQTTQQVRRLLLHLCRAAQTRESTVVSLSPSQASPSENTKKLQELLIIIEQKYLQLQENNAHDPVLMEALAQRISQLKERLQQTANTS
ncbi:hypothetical protein HYW21_00610 [Candidatus Woesearchaeota archaeon]|nr:hypothetical protein [Candidatus Woesearchaeota archaeon]